MADPQVFTVDTRAAGTGSTALDAFAQGWHDDVGNDQLLPTFTATSTAGMQGVASAGRLADVTLVDVDVVAPMKTAALPEHHDREVRLYAVRRGHMTLDDPDGRGRHVIPAGGFALQHVHRSVHFETSAGLELQVISLPAEPLTPLLRGRLRSGSIEMAEMRLLLSHARAAQGALADLGPAGRWAVRNTLIELTRAVALNRFDDRNPDLAPALVSAARALADTRLTDPALASSMLAGELNVSLRTLQRAFAETGEPVSDYVRRRRLESARRALLTTPGLKVSEAAAHWQFTDSSHFVRSFRKLFGVSPGGLSRRP